MPFSTVSDLQHNTGQFVFPSCKLLVLHEPHYKKKEMVGPSSYCKWLEMDPNAVTAISGQKEI